MGVAVPIETCNVFPAAEGFGTTENSPLSDIDMIALAAMGNYKSFDENEDESVDEFDRMVKEKLVHVLSSEEMERFKLGRVNKMATIVKYKRDNSKKSRII
eukprot:2306507-Heterocapsa_arctica.AAC.1